MNLRVIAGRGEAGAMSWGASVVRHPQTIRAELKRLQPYIGKKVFLGGGGGMDFHSCILDNAKLVNYKNMGKALRVFLSEVNAPMSYHDDGKFDPYIDSWQILVEIKKVDGISDNPSE
jgi:hypothetical protein